MKGSIIIGLHVYFCVLMVNWVGPMPVPDLEAYPGGCVHSEQKGDLLRARRSLPDMDAVNPAYSPNVAEGQESNVEDMQDTGKDSDISSFAIVDQMSELFRSNKDKDTQTLPQLKPVPDDQPVDMAKDDELVQRDVLSSDEQIECYKQQNFEPSVNSFEPQPKPILRLKDQRPFADAFQNKERVLSRPLIYKEKETRKFQGREEDADEITSLYSDPEKRNGNKNEKELLGQPKNQNRLQEVHERSVYKPVGVRPEFPMYDEDIDFHPDPLQGILEDKYWLDPQEQEAVIRKYIDLANNMQPSRIDNIKREPLKEHELKSVDSKEAFREADAVDRECPCREMAACKDCSKGKWGKKTNFSNLHDEVYLHDKYEKRKLLQANDMEYDNNPGDSPDNDETSFHTGGYDVNLHIDPKYNSLDLEDEEPKKDIEDVSFTSNIFGRKLLSFENDVGVDQDDAEDGYPENAEYKMSENVQSNSESVLYNGIEESAKYNKNSYDSEDQEPKEDIEDISFTSNIFGRKLLSFENDEDTNGGYPEDEDPEIAEYKISEDVQSNTESLLYRGIEESENNKNRHRKMNNRRSISVDNNNKDERKAPNEKHYNSPVILAPSNSGVYEYNLETEKIGTEDKNQKLNPIDKFINMQKPFLDKPHNTAKYYVPNKLGNLLQKAIIQKKPKEKPTTIDPDLEFELGKNETFLNVSIAMNDINVSVTTDEPNLVRIQKRREQPILLGTKGRRSYQFPLIKHPSVKKLQGADDAANLDVSNGNVTVNASSSSDSSLPTTPNSNATSDNATDTNSNNTAQMTPATPAETTGTANATDTANITETSSTQFYKKAKAKQKEEYDEDSFDAEVANDIVETVIAESQSGSVVGHNLGLCRRNESISKYAKVSPESELLLKKVTECILNRIRDRLEGQSCTLLDNELLEFLKWMVLSGESYKDYLARIKPGLRKFKSDVHEDGDGLGPPPRPAQVVVNAKTT